MAPLTVHVSRLLAAFAGLDLHVGELLDLGRLPDVVEDGERFQVLGDTAGRRRRFGVDGVVQTQHLKRRHGEKVKPGSVSPGSRPRLSTLECWVSALHRYGQAPAQKLAS